MDHGFGSALKQLRSQLGLSQSALANAINTTQRHVSFLETGRSKPSRLMIGRLATELNLSIGQRATLFEGSGMPNPYKRRDFSSAEVTLALDTIERRVLANWPFPAFVLDGEWTALRMNNPAQKMFAPYIESMGGELNMFSLFLSPLFRGQIENWEEAGATVYFRLQAAAAGSRRLHDELEAARQAGVFDFVTRKMAEVGDVPVFIPIIFRLPNGARLKATSLLGRLVSVHDALVEGFEIEMLVPVDEESEGLLRLIS